jgi:K+:H+ antiporter
MGAATRYAVLVGIPAALLLAVLHAAGHPAAADAPGWHPAAPAAGPVRLLAQVVVILAAARITGGLAARAGQPRVVGEMAAGLLLGPSLLGRAAPDAYGALFEPASLAPLQAVGQVGLVFYMFVVGLELDLGLLRGRGRAAVLVSHGSIVGPFLLGTLLAPWLYGRFAPPGTPFTGFALFLGTAMSVTAFPVLARIIAERGLAGTRVGALALACAAVDDVTAWTLLAAVVLLVRGPHGALPLPATLAGSLAFAALMLAAVRPALARAGARPGGDGRLTHERMAALLLFPLACALTTEWLGIHALFGAFLAGAVFPRRHPLARALARRLADFTVVFFLPLFFALTGLRVHFGPGAGWGDWKVFLAVVAVAAAGKLGGAALAARLSGMGWREAAAVGVLMNTRGLVELVVLNVGLEAGVISTGLFSVMVVMALATTAATAPLLAAIGPSRAPAAAGAGRVGIRPMRPLAGNRT